MDEIIRFERLKKVLKKKEYEDFIKYLEGQTVPIGGIYLWDFVRWLNEQEVID